MFIDKKARIYFEKTKLSNIGFALGLSLSYLLALSPTHVRGHFLPSILLFAPAVSARAPVLTWACACAQCFMCSKGFLANGNRIYEHTHQCFQEGSIVVIRLDMRTGWSLVRLVMKWNSWQRRSQIIHAWFFTSVDSRYFAKIVFVCIYLVVRGYTCDLQNEQARCLFGWGIMIIWRRLVWWKVQKA